MVGLPFAAVQTLGTIGKFASGLAAADARQGEFAEQLRQLRLKRDYTVSLTTAMADASGVTSDSKSTVGYLKSMTSQFDQSVSNLDKVAKDTAWADGLANITGLIGGGASTVGGIGQANNWKF